MLVVSGALQPHRHLRLFSVGNQPFKRMQGARKTKLVARYEAYASNKSTEPQPRCLPQVNVQGHRTALGRTAQEDPASRPFKPGNFLMHDSAQSVPRFLQSTGISNMVSIW
eukprot:CAMPEP_0179060186 /NCGR_PEP_ID=MMETSP0796-20121207/25735_1 /TAXON_ID=73915 /ORGANISM="Pyrodinium bahamense, Strain pbaha01" /LENGTH=110 /DNA_ID=CAMNT_0020756959 /DNA_START=265 /DNA_END=594 /DNA_ORIENTATION=-